VTLRPSSSTGGDTGEDGDDDGDEQPVEEGGSAVGFGATKMLFGNVVVAALLALRN
jgi:hypothetical protein